MTYIPDKKRALVVGTGIFAEALLKQIKRRPDCDYEIAGIIAERATGLSHILGYPLLGEMADLQTIMREIKPDCIIVTLHRQREYQCLHKLVEVKFCGNIKVEDGETVYGMLTGKLALEALTPGTVIFTEDFQPSKFAQACNRIFSLVMSAVCFTLLSPLMLLIALMIKLDSPGPVFFIQERVGRNCRPFRLIKFRTMVPEKSNASEWESDNLHRITRCGRILRDYRLDELPQFINVLRGDMDIVGPRPHPLSNYELFVLVSRNTPDCGGQIPYYSLRSRVRPGITGWAQVRYRYANTLNEEIEKLRFDLYYIKNYSLWLNIQILWETVSVVVAGKDAQKPVYPQQYAGGRT